jgi:hypothetical protein
MNNANAEEKSEVKSSLYVEQGYIVHTHHSPTCYEEEYVLEWDSRSYCCSMISRLVWMNIDTQDTCNIKQIPSPDWHTRYMQHKTNSIPSMFHLTHIYNCTIIYRMLPSQVKIPSQHQLGETLYKTPLEEVSYQSSGLIVHQVVTSDGLLVICKHINLVLLVLILLKISTLILLLVPF